MAEIRINTCFNSEQEKMDLVAACENDFSRRISDLCEYIDSNNDIPAMTLCGPTCSGKTITSDIIIDRINKIGKSVYLVSIDDFFYDRESLNRTAASFGSKLDYDSPSALDFDYLAECVEGISKGRTVELPHYDFKTGTRDYYVSYTPKASEIVLYEGIQALYPEFTKLIDDDVVSIYVCPQDSYTYEINGKVTHISQTEVRLARRLVRDFKFRNAPPAFTYYLWENVVANEQKNIYPYVHTADVFVNTSVHCEVSLLRDPLADVLANLPRECEYYDDAMSLLAKFTPVEPISQSLVYDNSIYKEFLG